MNFNIQFTTLYSDSHQSFGKLEILTGDEITLTEAKEIKNFIENAIEFKKKHDRRFDGIKHFKELQLENQSLKEIKKIIVEFMEKFQNNDFDLTQSKFHLAQLFYDLKQKMGDSKHD